MEAAAEAVVGRFGRLETLPHLIAVADLVLFTVMRPRRMRILTTSFRPMTEPSWG